MKLEEMTAEASDALVFFECELLARLQRTAALIKKLQKNPQASKINELKRKLIIRNMERQQKVAAEE